MRELGIRCVIGTTFGGIFGDNCARNGVPAITVSVDEVDRLMSLAADPARCTVTVDLEAQVIATPGDGRELRFEFNAMLRQMLLQGQDSVGLTLEYLDDIRRFEAEHHRRRPWLA